MSAVQEHEETLSSPDIHFEPIVTLAKVDVRTLEENEEEMIKIRAKLFRYIIGQHDTTPEWKERGVGDVKILKNKTEHTYRLVMRREKTLKVCANHFLTQDMDLKSNCGSDRAWVWNVTADFAEEKPQKETLAIRFANAENAKKFKDVFDNCKDKLKSTPCDVESEKLASELESLKVKDENESVKESEQTEKCNGQAAVVEDGERAKEEGRTGEETNTEETSEVDTKTEATKREETKEEETKTEEIKVEPEDDRKAEETEKVDETPSTEISDADKPCEEIEGQ